MGTSVADAPLSWPARLLLAAFGILLALGTGEAALRATHFHFDLIPALEFGWPDPVTMRDAYIGDPDLVWVTRNYHDALRSAHSAHPAVVFMGDSCTQFGSYPSKTIAALEAAGSTLTPGAKLGVGGWSSTQGLVQLRRDVIPLHPKIVTIYYGWNDHWKAMGLTDPEIMRADRLRALADHLRLAQLWIKLEVGFAAHRTPVPNRVPIQEYHSNLLHMASEARAAGITPMFITAPSNHVAGHEPAYLAKRELRTLSELVPLHAAYVQATREAAAAAGAPVCDAAAAFAALPGRHDLYFREDGIHLTLVGDVEMANILSACLLRVPQAAPGVQ
jgi:lysophospholipase L1-like esterase